VAGYPFDIINHFKDGELNSTQVAELLKQRPFLTRRVDRQQEAGMYEPSEKLTAAINVAIAVGRPLLLTGEPGTGKTMAAYFIAQRLGLGDLIRFQVKSDSRARDLLYEFDAVARLRETDPKAANPLRGELVAPQDRSSDPTKNPLWRYVTERELWLALKGGPLGPRILLIDEIDKAPRDFPNDLLRELEDLCFTVTEIDPPDNMIVGDPERAPIVVITSNSERRLPEPFLRRCVCHHIEVKDEDVERIVRLRLGKLDTTYLREPFISEALRCFLAIRGNRQLDKRPAVDEFWTWLETFEDASDQGAKRRNEVSLAAERLRSGAPALLSTLPAIGCLVKTIDDVARVG
jgi:MoxR-like ATPase